MEKAKATGALKARTAEDRRDRPREVAHHPGGGGGSNGARWKGLPEGREGGKLNHRIKGGTCEPPKQTMNGKLAEVREDKSNGKLRMESNGSGAFSVYSSKEGYQPVEERGAAEHRKGKSVCVPLKQGLVPQL